VVWKLPRKGPHKGKERYFTSPDFIAQLTLHIPDKGKPFDKFRTGIWCGGMAYTLPEAEARGRNIRRCGHGRRPREMRIHAPRGM
jgi:hypothetical protein